MVNAAVSKISKSLLARLVVHIVGNYLSTLPIERTEKEKKDDVFYLLGNKLIASHLPEGTLGGQQDGTIPISNNKSVMTEKHASRVPPGNLVSLRATGVCPPCQFQQNGQKPTRDNIMSVNLPG